MATKNIKSVGKIHGQTVEYWKNASKQMAYPVDFEHGHISVPINDVEKAKENLMVQHFINAGFFIQTCIPDSVSETKVFDPEIRLKLPAVKIAPDNAVYHIGDRFRIKSTDCELEIETVESKKIHLKYLNRNKHNLISSEEMLSKKVSWGAWIFINRK